MIADLIHLTPIFDSILFDAFTCLRLQVYHFRSVPGAKNIITPTSRYFDQYPELSADLNVASIPRISLDQLKNIVNEESERLFQACPESGFFLLELRNGDQGETLLGDAEKLFVIASLTLSLDHEVLKEYAYQPPKSILGYTTSEYEAPGVSKTDVGKLDNTAIYSLGQDDILGTSSPCANPWPIEITVKIANRSSIMPMEFWTSF
ncbi:hypothetical protein BTUL_0070g00550 [Botrytis tulipae]|uniref:Uncharacterized protein n=1 Tax=Botrytis tulipae TaxID=87230 RepID=A0A4Z1EM81_9HELO|nr:hypothetical protein BTUL_0070g00550 [Botrytis tulipae]